MTITILKDCPLCGGTAGCVDDIDDYGGVGCSKCQCFLMYQNDPEAKRSAILRWNTRVRKVREN